MQRLIAEQSMADNEYFQGMFPARSNARNDVFPHFL